MANTFRIVPDWLWMAAGRKHSFAVIVYCCIARHANGAGVAWPALSTIAEQTSASTDTVRRAISWLIAEGAVEEDARPGKVSVFRPTPGTLAGGTHSKPAVPLANAEHQPPAVVQGVPLANLQRPPAGLRPPLAGLRGDPPQGCGTNDTQEREPRTSSTTHSKSQTERKELAGKLDIPPARVGPLLRWLAESAAADKWRHLATDHDQLARMWRFKGEDGGNLLRATAKRSLFDDLDREDARSAAARKELQAARADRARREKAGPMSEEERERRRLAARRFTG